MSDYTFKGLSAVWTDFNAKGWSGENDDPCYYVINLQRLHVDEITEGRRFFAYMEENQSSAEIVGCEALLEKYRDGWRARPVENTWFNGQAPWTKAINHVERT